MTAHISSPRASSSTTGLTTSHNPIYGHSRPLVQINGHSETSSRPFERIDINGIKKELHDALGENGLRYWKALNGYLLAQVGRDELEDLVRGWLKGKKIHLHNRLLSSLLHNAASPTTANVPSSPTTTKRRKTSADFDTDENVIETRRRVEQWILGMGARERARLRRVCFGREDEEEDDDDDEDGDEDGEGSRGMGKSWELRGKKRMIDFNIYLDAAQPPLSLPSRQLPSAMQLNQRLSTVAQSFNLSLPDNGDIGEFMAVGVDSTLGDVLHRVVHLTGRERPGLGTIRVPKGHAHKRRRQRRRKNDPNRMDVDQDHGRSSPSDQGGASDDADDNDDDDDERAQQGLPTPNLKTFRNLFTISPGVYSLISPAVYKLQTGISEIEAELNNPTKPSVKEVSIDNILPHASPVKPESHMNGTGNDTSPSKSTIPLPIIQRLPYTSNGFSHNKTESVTQNLINTGLLKLDKAGRPGEGGEEVAGGGGAVAGGKKSKHNLHWKYEDPAIILKDVLG